jgi:hypothetical protein
MLPSAAMSVRSLVLVVAVYVSLDVTNPFMPGVFTFDPEESVESLHAERGRPPLVVLAAATAPRLKRDRVTSASPRPTAVGRKWLGEPRRAHSPASDPPPVPEDH